MYIFRLFRTNDRQQNIDNVLMTKHIIFLYNICYLFKIVILVHRNIIKSYFIIIFIMNQEINKHYPT